jgi:hypothetical protein
MWNWCERVWRMAFAQAILGTYLLKQQGLTKSFLRICVEALRTVGDADLDEVSKHLEHREISKGFEVEVRVALSTLGRIF